MSPSPSCGWNAGSVLHVTYSNLSGPNQSLKCSKWRKALISLALSETYWWIPESGLSLNLLTRYGKAFNTGYFVGSVVPSSTESLRGGRVCLSVCVSHMCLSVDICVCGGRRTISEDNWVPGPHRPLYLSPCLSTASLLYTASELPIILLTPPPISQARDTLGCSGCLNSGHQAWTASTLPTGPILSAAWHQLSVSVFVSRWNPAQAGLVSNFWVQATITPQHSTVRTIDTPPCLTSDLFLMTPKGSGLRKEL